jgi:hypothetical protein
MDDTAGQSAPPAFFGALSQWVVCQGENYSNARDVPTLMWVLRSQKPENPSCVSVDLIAEPISS